MDRVRFGRVLGRGARLAARTAIEAVDAATASSPAARPQANPASTSHENLSASSSPRASSGTTAKARRVPTVLNATTMGTAMKAARVGVGTPLRAASSALWHELTGSFFALFALSFGAGVWHTRSLAHSRVPADQYRLAGFCLLTLLFAYFSASNFLRARQRTAR